MNTKKIDRRAFLKSGLYFGAALGMSAFPLIVPSRLLGRQAPSNTITVGCIGTGRMGTGDLRAFLELEDVRVIAVCDVDRRRAAQAARLVDEHYAAGASGKACAIYHDFRQLIAREDIDVVSITTPDHWHALQGIAAARAGKDIFIQKPLSYSIAEGRALSDAVRQNDLILQVGSQQRSDARFRFACELVRNQRIGRLQRIEVGFGKDTTCPPQPVQPVPDNLDYDFWLGPAPSRPYTEWRVHPQHDLSRPGWLRTEDYCLGMITGWGSHHMDIAHWGMGEEHGGPAEIEASAVFPDDGLWNVHQEFDITYKYANGVVVSCTDNSRNSQGVRFIGSNGWVYVRRGFIDASPKSLLQEKIRPEEVHLYKSSGHKRNFIDCVKSRRQPVAPVEIGHRSGSACIVGHIAMRLGQPLKWDVKSERFVNNDQANRMLLRPMRSPWHL